MLRGFSAGACVCALASLFLFACGSSDAGGPADGGADTHCGSTVQVVDPSTCSEVADGGMDMDMSDYGATMYGSEGDDDDCKYHVAWTSTEVKQNEDVTFTVTATTKSDGKAASGAAVLAEVFLSDTHPAPNSNQQTTESPSGTYKIGPVRFDQPGRWTVRFHLHEDCTDTDEASPHGHAAFYVDVP